MLLLDLDQLHRFAKTRLKVNRRGLVSFQTTRHLIDPRIPSGEQARQFVKDHLPAAPDVSGAVQLLTNPHMFGLGFNPLSVYFLHDKDQAPAAVILEVSNTPWNEIHRYALPADALISGDTVEFDKTFHVSPFNPMNQTYLTRIQWPDATQCSVYLGLKDHGQDATMFEAGLSLQLQPFSGLQLRPLFLGIWPQTLVVVGGIYRQAFALWRKGIPYHAHP